jgi:23S rRNA (pseudouridine1915-N3)-methyltransferase
VIRRATVVAIGRLRGWAAEGCEDYLVRLRRYFSVKVTEVPEEDMNRPLQRTCSSLKASACSSGSPLGPT